MGIIQKIRMDMAHAPTPDDIAKLNDRLTLIQIRAGALIHEACKRNNLDSNSSCLVSDLKYLSEKSMHNLAFCSKCIEEREYASARDFFRKAELQAKNMELKAEKLTEILRKRG